MAKPLGLILDFDGVFYKYDPQFNDVCSNAAARAAIACGVPDRHESLFAAFMKVGDPHSFTKQWQEQHGLDQHRFHHAYHDGIDVQSSIAARQEATATFTALAARRIPMVILTHGSQPWVKRVLSQIGLPDFLPDSHIIGLEHTEFVKKSQSGQPVVKAANRLGIALDRLAMIEDSHGNLVHAHTLAVKTGFLHYGKPLSPQPEHVHVQAPSVASLVKDLGF